LPIALLKKGTDRSVHDEVALEARNLRKGTE
jgi:hypothetical protein